MDESLSDFQETKLNYKGPKTTQKVVKTKARKVTKRIKGQKDIRTALKGKKNELISYTKEFENVCKRSGIDVDSEHLQVAIALSKSLQTDVVDDVSTSKPQGRSARIRTTLQEYGFKVPDLKITAKSRIKKHRKQYKLLNISEEEKHQKIRNKFSQILFETLDYKPIAGSSYQSCTPIFNIATKLEYEFMKNNNIFYVNSLANLIERYTSIGSLLKNWAVIPGRPVSPQFFEESTMDFSEILCSQDELDIILSGPIKSANRIITSKVLDSEKLIDSNVPKDEPESEGNYKVKEDDKENKLDHVTINIDEEVKVNEIILSKSSEFGKVTTNTLTVQEQYRSCSPDLFDDEVSCIMESTKQVLSQEQKTKLFTEEGSNMDLTECANIHFGKAESICTNATKIIHNDFMEMTECAISASQGIKGNVKEIDLTQSPDETSILEMNCNTRNFMVESPDNSFNESNVHKTDPAVSHIEEDNRSTVNKSPIECIDLFINSSTSNNKIISKSEIFVEELSDEIDLTQSSNENENIKAAIIQGDVVKEKVESMDLTQSSKSSVESDDLPEINLVRTQKSQTDLDDTIILKEEEYLSAVDKVKKPEVTEDEQIFDLTQVGEEFIKDDNLPKERISKLSFYEDFIHDHSDDHQNIANVEHSNANNSITNPSKDSDIDLTQRSDSSTDNNSINNLSKENIDLIQTSDKSTDQRDCPRLIYVKNIPNNSNLGKKNDISIDYDEICDGGGNESILKENFDLDRDSSIVQPQNDNDLEIVDSNNDLTSNVSQTSEVFDLTDKELDYSLHKSKLDQPMANFDYDFDGISVVDDNIESENLENCLSCSSDKNGSLEESYLPDINIGRTEKATDHDDKIDACCSPNKAGNTNHNRNTIPIVTPKNSEYVIKTNNVTPMVDYALMTTPQRNKELDKYGLKPFKRKRGNSYI